VSQEARAEQGGGTRDHHDRRHESDELQDALVAA